MGIGIGSFYQAKNIFSEIEKVYILVLQHTCISIQSYSRQSSLSNLQESSALTLNSQKALTLSSF